VARLNRRFILLTIVVVVAAFLISAGGFAAFLGAIILGICAIAIWRIIKKRARRNTSTRRIDVSRTAGLSLDRQEYGTPCVTLNGEAVRSRGECKVADFLFRNSIRYEYEPRVYGKTTRSNNRGHTGQDRIIGKPDFLLLDYGILVEYWGMVTVPDPADRENYQRKMNEKKVLYQQNGYKLISLYSWDLDNLQFEFNRQFSLLTGGKTSQT
jgi:hypothetical protein